MPIRTTVVGSYPVPRWLYGDTSKTTLRDAISVVLKTQELAGIDVVADGELARFDPSHPETNGMIDYFVSPLDGIKTKYSISDIDKFRADQGMSFRSDPAGVVTGPIGDGTLNLLADYELTRPLTKSTLKFTCTGPHMLAKTLTNRHYADYGEVAMALAQVLRRQLERIPAEIVQIDEANIPGHPEDIEWALPALNHVLDGIKGEKGVHICFGNYGGQSIQRGTWEALLPLLNGMHADHYILELARRGYGELDVLKEVDKSKGIGLSVIDIKDNEVESPDLIAKRIEHAASLLGKERIHFVHPDCGFWMLTRSVADRKMKSLVEGQKKFAGN